MEVCVQETVYAKKEVATACQGGKVATARLWSVKTTAAGMVFAVQKNQTNVSVIRDGVVQIVPSGCAQMLAQNTVIATTELVFAGKDGKV